MSRPERLLALLQILRRHRRPVSGKTLADELRISLRTLYRDIAALQAQGANVEGEPGFGYVLRPGFLLPPLMFSPDELEALALGSRWVARSADARLGLAAEDALAKIAEVLPTERRDEIDVPTLLVGPKLRTADTVDVGLIRLTIRTERKLEIVYTDKSGAGSERTIWPFALGIFDAARVLVAWCELRAGIRHFRRDRISDLRRLEARYPRRRRDLMKEWRETHPATQVRDAPLPESDIALR